MATITSRLGRTAQKLLIGTSRNWRSSSRDKRLPLASENVKCPSTYATSLQNSWSLIALETPCSCNPHSRYLRSNYALFGIQVEYFLSSSVWLRTLEIQDKQHKTYARNEVFLKETCSCRWCSVKFYHCPCHHILLIWEWQHYLYCEVFTLCV